MFVYLSMIEDDYMRERLTSIYMKYRNLMFYAANNILHNEHDAEDIVHDAFVIFIDYLDRFDDKEYNIKPFLLTIVENRAINLWKRQRHFGEQVPYDEEIHTIAGKSENIGLEEAIERLSPEYRSVILLRFHFGFTTREIAKMLGKKEGTVTRTITRAKVKLSKELENIRKELSEI